MGAFLASLRAAVLRVAVAAGGADAGLNETSVATLSSWLATRLGRGRGGGQWAGVAVGLR